MVLASPGRRRIQAGQARIGFDASTNKRGLAITASTRPGRFSSG